MQFMMPELKMTFPEKGNWLFETKYDGFRAQLIWTKETVQLLSRNGQNILPLFPEIKNFLKPFQKKASSFLPLVFDGELAALQSEGKSNFSVVQTRGRMRSPSKIAEKASFFPCTYLVFDLLEIKGQFIKSQPFEKRKEQLYRVFESFGWSLSPKPSAESRIQMIPSFRELSTLKDFVSLHFGEGIVAKKQESIWEGKRSGNWIKIKNWKKARCFVTAFHEANGYYDIAVYKDKNIFPIGLFQAGIPKKEKEALNQIIRQNAFEKKEDVYYIKPGICVELFYLEWQKEGLREPYFHQFLFSTTPEECTWEQFRLDSLHIPEQVEITHPLKPIWPACGYTKLDYLSYLRKTAPRMLPFLKDRVLTVIRYPHGVEDEAFFQKNCPDYAPDFVETKKMDGINYIVCNSLETLIWLGNQLVIEFHVPFHSIHSSYVSEIVFDLDPPSPKEFSLAVQAAKDMKEIFDQLNLKTFVKFSGNKGLQVYIPLPETFTFAETGSFTELIARYLVSKKPEMFTIERLKKKRGRRLYIDYVQYRQGKTIIAPYSARGNEKGLVACPLYWEELDQFTPSQCTIDWVLKRMETTLCPFASFFEAKVDQPFAEIINALPQLD
ncbi:DNA ligase D [Bacillus smithii]|uniref:DNA ligase D n=1 Tax=Bacillus smithii TaxID=1479 RepID=UPI002E1C1877|nr:DNA ligase D [Bacillus smithii]